MASEADRDRLFEEMNVRLDELNRARRNLRYRARKYREAWTAWLDAARAIEIGKAGEDEE